MIVVMKKGATAEQIAHMVDRVEQLGLKSHVIYGTERTVIAAIGEKRDEYRQSLESGPGVAEVVPILAPYKVASREVKAEPTTIRAGTLAVGNRHIGVIAGPCAVESEAQMLATARAVKAAGATALRGGAFKPRTSPYSFQGLKEEGLKILAAARQATGPGRGHRGPRRARRPAGGRAMPTCCRSAPATCRTTGCWRRWASRAGRCC